MTQHMPKNAPVIMIICYLYPLYLFKGIHKLSQIMSINKNLSTRTVFFFNTVHSYKDDGHKTG